MVVVTLSHSSSTQTHFHFTTTCKPTSSPFLLHIHKIYSIPKTRTPTKASNTNGVLSIKAYMEKPNSISNFANKVIGSLPVVGLVARILSDEGGVGGDIIDFAEFRRRVGKKCSVTDSRAFYDFQQRHGKAGEPLYVLLCCWLAAVGAGLLKSEEILEGVGRLRISDDIEFEEQTFIALMNEAKERRARVNIRTPSVPMEVRVEKALDAIYVCCFGQDLFEEEDERLLSVMLKAVFPSVEQPEIQRIIEDKAKKVADGSDDSKFSESKRLPKEAIEQQMKDLQFLKQNNDT